MFLSRPVKTRAEGEGAYGMDGGGGDGGEREGGLEHEKFFNISPRARISQTRALRLCGK